MGSALGQCHTGIASLQLRCTTLKFERHMPYGAVKQRAVTQRVRVGQGDKRGCCAMQK